MSWRDRWKWQVNHLNEIFLQILQCIIHFNFFFSLSLFAPQNPDRIIFFGAFFLYYNFSSFSSFLSFSYCSPPIFILRIFCWSYSWMYNIYITHSTTTAVAAAMAATQNTFIMCSQRQPISLIMATCVSVFVLIWSMDRQLFHSNFVQQLCTGCLQCSFLLLSTSPNDLVFFLFLSTFPFSPFSFFSSSSFCVLLIHPNSHSLT